MAEPEIRYAPGTIIARKYRVESVIGAGGMGVVYKVTHERLRKRVYAMKTLHQSLLSSEHLVARFFNEAEIHSKIDAAEDADIGREGHKNIARIYDCDRAEDGTPFYVMEFLQGASLRKILWGSESRRFNLRRSLDIAISLFEALAYAHERGVIHRDIKPDNIFIHTIGPFSEVKIVDFGIARILSSPAGTGERFLGTIAYSPREHLLGKPPTAKIDIYAATQVLFLMLVGRTPFAALRTERALGQALLSPTPPIAPLLTTFGDFPELLVSIVASGLSHNPDERLPADAMAKHLRRVEAQLGFADPIDVNATIEDLSTAVHTVVGEEGAPAPSSTARERDRQAIRIAPTTPAAKDGDTKPDGSKPDGKPLSSVPSLGAPAESHHARPAVNVAHHGATQISNFAPPLAPSSPSAVNSSPPRSWEPPRSAPEIDHSAHTRAALEQALMAESHAPTHTAPMPDRPATPPSQAGTPARKTMNDTEPLPIDFLAMLGKRHPSAAPQALAAPAAGTTPPIVKVLETRVPQRHIWMASGTILGVVFVGLSIIFLFFAGEAASKRAATRAAEPAVTAAASQPQPFASVTPAAVAPLLPEPEVPASSVASTAPRLEPAVKPSKQRIEVPRPTPSTKSSNSDLQEWRTPPPFVAPSAEQAVPTAPRKKLPSSGL